MKKVYTAAFKAQVALDLLKQEKSMAQISAEYGVHPNVLRDWRTQALKGLTTIFDRRADLAAPKTAPAQKVEELYAEIGRLATQLNWLKKSCQPPLSGPTSADRAGGRHTGAAHPSGAAEYQSYASVVSAIATIGVRGGDQTSHRRAVYRLPVLWIAQADG